MSVVFFFLMIQRPPRSTRTGTVFPYTTLFRSARFERVTIIACARESERQRHGEAGRMCRGDQFLGIGPRLPLEARPEAIGLLVEHARLGRDRPLALLAEPFVAARRAVAIVERRVGKEWFCTCRSRWARLH